MTLPIPDDTLSRRDAPETLPRWDMTPIFPSLTSPQFEQAFEGVIADIGALGVLFDRLGVAGDTAPSVIDDAAVAAFDEAATAFNHVLKTLGTVRAYISAFVSTDTRDTVAQARASELRTRTLKLTLLSTRFTAWLGALDTEALIAASPLAAEHDYYLREAKIIATHLLPPAEEELTSQLALSGGTAWSRLYEDFTSQLTVPLRRTADSDPEERLPMSLIRALATDPDRTVRRRAYEAELAAWECSTTPIAAAINSIKYETGLISARRRWESPLDAACFHNHIDRATLEAMLSAARASFPDFRRYLRLKARAVSGAERIAWFDLTAPMGEARRTWTWNEATEFVAEQFGTYSDKMRAFAERAFRENWIDAGPRPGKRGGAFCSSIRGDESRILHNYQPSFDGMSTLAHELGHGYHNTCLAGRTPMQRGTPSTLAETASIFCETIIREAALRGGDREDQLAILEATLEGECQVVVDIYSRFLFEQSVLDARRQRELSVEELKALMLDAQEATYGDGLDENFRHPYMWAAKVHYYIASFYNFPYMFGQLFGMGLYARYKQDPSSFYAGYDELLSLTGMSDAASLAARFGFDLRDEAFWRSSIDLIVQDIDRFEALLTPGAGSAAE